MIYTNVATPIGSLLVAGNEDETVTAIGFAGRAPGLGWVRNDRAFSSVAAQLNEYFQGHRREFDIALDLQGTPFQKSVWQALLRIPYGQTRSYAEIAREIGRPSSCRAVGAANGANPIPLVVPCHRVIGSNGSMIGFGGGLEVKRHLLALEAVASAPLFAAAQ